MNHVKWQQDDLCGCASSHSRRVLGGLLVQHHGRRLPWQGWGTPVGPGSENGVFGWKEVKPNEGLEIYGNLTRHFHISIVGLDELDELDELDVMSPWPWPFVLSKQSLCFTRRFLRKIWRICAMTARLGQEKCGVTVFRLKYDQEWRPESWAELAEQSREGFRFACCWLQDVASSTRLNWSKTAMERAKLSDSSDSRSFHPSSGWKTARQRFCKSNKLKKLAIHISAAHLSAPEVLKMKDARNMTWQSGNTD